MDLLLGNHHLTSSVADPQSDYDFHVGVLGLKCVKKTVLFDGEIPIYHLYYGNGDGEESTLLTTFPWEQAGVFGRRGGQQIKSLNLTVPDGSRSFWGDRLAKAGVDFTETKPFGEWRLEFAHPCGIEYTLTGTTDDPRTPYTEGGVGQEHAIRGVDGVTVSTADLRPMEEFVETAMGGDKLDSGSGRTLFRVGPDHRGGKLDLVEEAGLPQATWGFGSGVVHHAAFHVAGPEEQKQVKAHLEGLGYTDTSESKNRFYFFSMYVRSPGGALIEIAYSTEEGFLKDETADELGKGYHVPPFFAERQEEIWSVLPKLDETKPYDY